MTNLHARRSARQRALGVVSASAIAVGLVATVSTVAPAQAAEGAGGIKKVDRAAVDAYEAGRYIVLMQQPSAAAYTGGIQGLAPTKPAAGRSFDPRSGAATAYRTFLEKQQRQVAAAVDATVTRSYTTATNGFAAQLTGEQATALAAAKDVYALVPVEARTPDAAPQNTAQTLGMYGKSGVWAKHGTQAKAGSGVVVGDLDTGIWPENPSFSGEELSGAPTGPWAARMDPLGNTTMKKADGGTFRGACETGTGDDWDLSDCSTKIIGARYYPDTFVDTVPPEEVAEGEFISPRDGGGHGSHTASTAAGNVVDDVSVDGIAFGEVTGMVPGASIASYKVCWEDTDPDTGGCYTDAILSAIDDAVRDGVDVINFSISGATDTVVDPVEIAFAGAADAGVFVAASAGNSGPTASTVAHNSPWLTTVAASTYRNFDGTVELGDGTRYLGAMIDGTGIPEQTPLVDSAEAGVAGGDADEAALCAPDSLDEAAVDGAIVVCLRGTYGRVEKSTEVARAGGVGMILVNPAESSLDADLHPVPTVHLQDTDLPAIEAYLDTDAPTAALLPGNQTDLPSAALPQVSGFSSRGPANANESDILKPDISAPGQSVLAAVAPPSNSGRDFDLYSGTSMAAPHIAGLGALLMAENPTWTPQMVQSAMMTTATSTRTAGDKASRDAFAQGAGQVTPASMFRPGLFVTSTSRQWYGLIADQGFDTGVKPVEAKAVNIPSMADHAVVQSTTFTRIVTTQGKGSWKVSASVPGFTTKVSKKSFSAGKAGVKRRLVITFTARDDVELNRWAKGFVKLTGTTAARMPVALKPVALDAPAVVTGEGADSDVDVTVKSGTTGTIDLTTQGLAQAESTEDSVAVNDAAFYCVPVTDASPLVRFDVDAADDLADLDLVTYEAADANCDQLTAQGPTSATGSADESVTIENPEAPFYLVEVDGFASGPQGSPMDFRLDVYDLGTAAQGSLTATPDPLEVTAGEESTYSLAWTGLDADARYLGRVLYGDTGISTLLEVTTATP